MVETFPPDGADSKYYRALRVLVFKATTADHAHVEEVQPSRLRSVHPHRVATTTLRHYYVVFYSQIVDTAVANNLFPSG